MKMHLLKSQWTSFISILPCAGIKNVHNGHGSELLWITGYCYSLLIFLVTKSKFISGYIKEMLSLLYF